MWIRNRQIKLMFLVLLCLVVYTSWNVYSSSKNSLSNDDFIRFHVIANSNTEEDQALKLKVRDGVLAKINSELVQEAMARHNLAQQSLRGEPENSAENKGNESTVGLDISESRSYIEDNLREIEKVADRIIRENGYEYKVAANLGVKWIPEKTYGDITFPAGNYEALHITIGEGEGENWWCVLFPPLCLIGLEAPENEEAVEEAQEIYKDIMLNKRYEPLVEERQKPTTLKLRFKTLELIDDLNK